MEWGVGLSACAEQTTTPITGHARRAITDCHTTLGVVRAMAAAPRYAEYQPPRTNRLRAAIAERLVVICNKRYHKKTTMQELDAELELLRRQVHLAMRLGFLPFKQYAHWARLNDEIGRLIGGWLRAQRNTQQGVGR